jgi:hypothetical protein
MSLEMTRERAVETFEIRDGHIVARRDYFDMGLVGKLMAGADTATVLPHSGISAVVPLGQSADRW